MDRNDWQFDHTWHVALNTFSGSKSSDNFPHWMYLAKCAAHEASRLPILFKMEREGALPDAHQQCSHAKPVPVIQNHLTCCLGIKCAECPELAALEVAAMTPEQQDEAKAWTCIGHILTEFGKRPNSFDESEGFILTVDDRMFWDSIYESSVNHWIDYFRKWEA